MRRSDVDREIADEVQHYLDEAEAAHRARGLSAMEARRAARLELGGVTRVQEQVRDYGWENLLETIWADLRYASRRLRAAPGFTAVAVLTLALGLGATTAIFSAVKPVLFEPLPYPKPDRVVAIWEVGREGSRADGTFGMFRELRAGSRAFDALSVLKPWQPTLSGTDQPERLEGQRVSAAYLDVLGVAPALGRFFTTAEDRMGGTNVVVVSDGLWQRRFGGDDTVIGRDIVLDDDAYTIVGVMPADFENVLAPAAEVWAPLQYDISQGRAWGHHLRTIGRLSAGVSLERAASDLDVIGARVLSEQQPETYGSNVQFVAVPLRDDLTSGVRPALMAIMGAVLLVLVMACVNVTNLLLARDARRHGELALRAALGAGARRLARQLITETMLLAMVGGLVGMALAIVGEGVLISLRPSDLPRGSAIGVDNAVFVFGLIVTTIVGLICGGVVALRAARRDPQGALQQSSSRAVGGHLRVRSTLIVVEIALAFALLVSSGLLLRSLRRLLSVDAGFEASQLVTMQVQTSGRSFDTDSTTYQFFSDALDAVRRVPGVMTASLTSQLPLSGDLDQYGVFFDPPISDDTGESRGAFRYAVSPGYFETMGIAPLGGRLLEESDRAGAPLVAVISQSLAKRRLPGRDPVGQRVRIGAGPLYTVVGVVDDVRQVSLALNEADAVYVTASQWRFADNVMSVVVRGQGDVTRIVPAVREAIWSVNKDQPIVRVATMDDLVAASTAQRRFALLAFEAFAMIALVLAAAGIYGVLAGSVAERTREIGLRAAMGASGARILALVLRQGMSLTLMGVAIGIVGAVLSTRAMTAMLFGLTPLDSPTYIGVVALLIAVSVGACSLPAWRASRVDPARALRAE